MAQSGGGAFGKITAGFVLFLASFGLLFWNEGRSVQTYNSLKEGMGLVQTIKSDSVDAQYDQKLVHTQGQAITTATINDADTNMSFSGVIKVKRIVEMYQWKEESSTKKVKQPDGSEKDVTEYSYQKIWSEDLIDSNKFNQKDGHANPGAMRPESQDFVANPVTVGAFTLSESLIAQMSDYKPYNIDESGLNMLPAIWSGKVKLSTNMLYVGDMTGTNPSSPMIGDIRIAYEVVHPGPVSIISQQAGNTFQAYQTKAGDTINLLKDGMHSSQAMFQSEIDKNSMMTWLLRALGLFMMYAGLMMLVGRLTFLADKIPFLGGLISGAVSFVMFLVALALSLVTVAIARFWYRPILSIILLVLAAGAVFGIRYLKSKEKKSDVSSAK